MRRRLLLFSLALLALLAAGTAIRAGADASPPAVFDGLLGGSRTTSALAELAPPDLEPGEEFRLSEIGRDAHTSHHMVWIRDREQPHRHDHHDLVAVIVRGHGQMLLGREERPVGEGSVLYIPRGTRHAFRNQSGAPSLAYAIYTPAIDPNDRIPDPDEAAGVGSGRP
jgi:mannose-6-phosphate isomerase-like protein (cupin superfamily)